MSNTEQRPDGGCDRLVGERRWRDLWRLPGNGPGGASPLGGAVSMMLEEAY